MNFDFDDVLDMKLDQDTFLCQICLMYPSIKPINKYSIQNEIYFYGCKVCNKLFCANCVRVLKSTNKLK